VRAPRDKAQTHRLQAVRPNVSPAVARSPAHGDEGESGWKRWVTSAGGFCLVRRSAQLGLSEWVSAAKDAAALTALQGISNQIKSRNVLDRRKNEEKGAGRAERSCTSGWLLLLLLAGLVESWLVCQLRLVMAGSAVEGGRRLTSSPRRRSRRSAWGLEIGALGRYKAL
jgi:hypothetical protein